MEANANDDEAAAREKSTPEEFMADARCKGLAGLKRKRCDDEEEKQGPAVEANGVDLNYLIGSTRVIVAVNQEVWERCKQHKCETETNTDMVFKRVDLSSVQAKTLPPKKLNFTIRPELTKKDFG